MSIDHLMCVVCGERIELGDEYCELLAPTHDGYELMICFHSGCIDEFDRRVPYEREAPHRITLSMS